MAVKLNQGFLWALLIIWPEGATRLGGYRRKNRRAKCGFCSSPAQLTRLRHRLLQATRTPFKWAPALRDDAPITGRTSLLKNTCFLPEPQPSELWSSE